MSMKAVVDCSTGITTLVELTEEELAEQAAQRERDTERRLAEEAAAEKKAADRESGNAKLKELGLTDDEIAALTT